MKITGRHWLLLFVVAVSAGCFSFLATPNGASAISGGGNTIMGDDLIPGVYDMNVIDQPATRFHVTFFGDGIVGISQPDINRTYATGHYKAEEIDDDGDDDEEGVNFTIIDDHFHLEDDRVVFVERHEWGGTIDENGVLSAKAEITIRDLEGTIVNQFVVELEGKRLPDPPSP